MFSKHHKSLLHLNLTSECFQTSSSHHSPNLDNSTLLVCQTINSSLISIIRFYILHLILHSSVRCFQRRLNGGQRPALIHACSLQYPSTQVPSQQTTAASMLPTPLLLLSRDASIRGSLLPYSPYIPGDFCELESACSTHSQKLSLALQLIWSKTTVLTVTLKVVWIPYSHYFIFSTNVAHSTPNTTPAAAAKRSEDYICVSLRCEDHRWEWLERKGKNCNSGQKRYDVYEIPK